MSAIFGIIGLNGQPVATDDLERMSIGLAEQGTDGGGIWQLGEAGLGQRLMCFTPEDRLERQPLVGADGQCILVSAGRIDNRPELMRELAIPAATALDLPDSAFILHAYEKWGDDCPGRLLGDYSFALWHCREKRLLLAQSPFSSNPLFFYRTPKLFVFATMPKGLFALPSVPREINNERLADYLAGAPGEPGSSIFRSIERLQGGNSLVVTRESLRVRQFWRINLKGELRLKHDDEYPEAFNELFGRTVSDHLRSLTPVGIMLSGGLDSTSIAATACPLLKSRGDRLTAFTEVPRTGFDGPVVKGRYADETPFVQAMARMYNNLDINLIRTEGPFYLQNLDRFFAATEIPRINASNLPWINAIHEESSRQGIRVLLSGDFGNLTISWSGAGLLAQLLRTGRWTSALNEARAMGNRKNSFPTLRVLVGQGILPLLPTLLWRSVTHLRRKIDPDFSVIPTLKVLSLIRPEFAEEQRVVQRAQEKGHEFPFRMRPDTRRIRVAALERVQDAKSSVVSGNRSRFGVELRDPTSDTRIIEFCLSLPEKQFLSMGVQRRLIRRAMAHRLPQEVLTNNERGLQASDWFERMGGAHAEILDELARLEQCQLARLALDLGRMRRIMEQLPHAGGSAESNLNDYRNLMETALVIGRFLRWFDAGG